MVAGITNPTLFVDRFSGEFGLRWDYDLREGNTQFALYNYYYLDIDSGTNVNEDSKTVRASGSDDEDEFFNGFGIFKGELHFDYYNGLSSSSRTYKVFEAGSEFNNLNISGTADKDIVITGFGDDTIRTKNSNDMVDAGFGRDTIEGGLAKDQLFGGAGADTFVYKTVKDSTVASSGRDTIMDFSHSQRDKIDLHFIDANTKVGGNQSFVFINDRDFTHHAGELRAVKSGGDTHISGDVNGDGKADFAIVLDPALTLQRGDFVL